jgi:hypothetical protein
MSALAWSGLSFFLGLLIGHWLAIGRDRRKEFNDSAYPVRAWILYQITYPEIGYQPAPKLSEMDALLQRLSARDRERFEKKWRSMAREFRLSTIVDPESGARTYTQNPRVLELLHEMEPMTRPR